ncbi:MAG: hypothetical protein QG622_3199 [Actinomycetota bacterium]|nr:hypothetical protein [Actinomycetota bacterium]
MTGPGSGRAARCVADTGIIVMLTLTVRFGWISVAPPPPEDWANEGRRPGRVSPDGSTGNRNHTGHHGGPPQEPLPVPNAAEEDAGPSTGSHRGSGRRPTSRRSLLEVWGGLGSNPRPTDYEWNDHLSQKPLSSAETPPAPFRDPRFLDYFRAGRSLPVRRRHYSRVGEVVPRHQGVRVVGPQHPLHVDQSRLVQGDGSIEVPRHLVGVGEEVRPGEGVVMVGIQHPLSTGEIDLVLRDRLPGHCSSRSRSQRDLLPSLDRQRVSNPSQALTLLSGIRRPYRSDPLLAFFACMYLKRRISGPTTWNSPSPSGVGSPWKVQPLIPDELGTTPTDSVRSTNSNAGP